MAKKLICYCFGYSEEDITRDVINNMGESTILKRIMDEKKNNGCNCRVNHPEGM